MQGTLHAGLEALRLAWPALLASPFVPSARASLLYLPLMPVARHANRCSIPWEGVMKTTMPGVFTVSRCQQPQGTSTDPAAFSA